MHRRTREDQAPPKRKSTAKPATPKAAKPKPGSKDDSGGGCLRGCFIIALILMFGLFGAGFGVLGVFLRGLPPLTALDKYRPQLVNRIYAGDKETKVAELFDEKRDLVSLDEVPLHLVNALLAIEDARYYEHPGVDVIRIAGALIADIKIGRLAQGGSTITQQLARNLFQDRRKTFERKIKEALLALRIEKHHTKQEILEMYLNQVYLGRGTYGVKAAAEFYYHKELTELTLAECASIVGLLKAPEEYSPVINTDASRIRRNIVLRRMLDEKFISQEVFDAAVAEAITVQAGKRTRVQQRIYFPYFVMYVQRLLQGIERPQGFPEPIIDPREYKLGGLTIETTVEPTLQQAAEKAVREGIISLEQHRRKYRYGWGDPNHPYKSGLALKVGEIYDARIRSVSGNHVRFDLPSVSTKQHEIGLDLDAIWLDDFDVLKPDYYFRVKAATKEADTWSFEYVWEPYVQAALVAMDPSSGEIRAMVGGYDFFDKDLKQGGQFIRAIQAARQPGSSFKPVIYATALNEGYTPSTLLSDERITFNYGRQSWSPKNYHDRYYNLIPLSTALELSQNCATVRLLTAIGIGKVQEMAQRLGFVSPLSNDLSLSLGTSDVSPLEMAVAYATFANEGRRVRPVFIRRVTDRSGKELYRSLPYAYPALRPEIAFQVTNILRGVIRYGTGQKAGDLPFPIAGKTGTTNNCMDTWFIGYAPNLSVAVYVGFDQKRSLGYQMTGSFCALPIWKSFMETALPFCVEQLRPEDSEEPYEMSFREPGGMVWVNICRFSGRLSGPSCSSSERHPFIAGTQPKEPCNIHGPGLSGEPFIGAESDYVEGL